MKPLHLTFRGLRSYRGEAEIDFSDLGLFAIIGDTGSGKSTIIEALSLALYARPTWGKQLDGLISDGASVWGVELTFEAGGRRWRVTRQRGHGGRHGIDKLEEVDGPTKVDGAVAVTDKVTEIVGLSHDQFTSAVVLPQGRFQKLLEATPADRAKLLTSLLGLEGLSATRALAERVLKQCAGDVEVWRALRARLGPDPAAAREEAETAATAAAERVERLDAWVARCDELEPRIAAVDQLRRALDEALGRLAPLPDDYGQQLASTHQAWSDAVGSAEAALAEQERVSRAVAELDARRGELLGDARDRDELARAIATATRVAGELPGHRKAIADAEQALARLQAAAPPADIDPALTEAVRAATEAQLQAQERHRSAQVALEVGRQRWHSLLQLRAEVAALGARAPELQHALDEADRARADAEREVAERETALDQTAAAHRAALVADAAAAAARDCHPGDPCPVCSRELPDGFTPPEAHDDVAAAEEAERRAREALEGARTRLTKRAVEAERASNELGTLRTKIDERVAEEAAAVAVAQEAGVDPDADGDEAAVASLLAAVRTTAAELEAATAAAQEAEGAATTARRALDEQRQQHNSDEGRAKGRLDTASQALLGLVTELDRLDPRDRDTPPEQRAARLVDDLEARLARLAELDLQREDLRLQERAADQAHSSAQTDVANARVRARELIGDLRAHRDAIERIRAAASISGGTSVPELPGEPPPVSGPDDLAGIVDRLDGDLAALAAVVDAARAVAGQAAEEHERLIGELESVLADAGCATPGELHAAAGAARSDAETARVTLEQRRAEAEEARSYDERLAVAAPFVANLTVLREALSNQRFVAHLVSERETELLAEASQRLGEITGGRFGFGPDFMVVNRYSGEVRSSNGLSGGERFQAALALALALTEIASRGSRGRLEAVFIDEGFGSLDATALEHALERLRTVSGDGTTVALVSHLRAVAEYVTDVLHVTRDETTGSRIRRLDAEALEAMLDDDVRSGLTA